MKPARFVLSIVGAALFLALGTVFIVAAIARFSGAPALGWEAGSGTVLVIVLLAVLIIRAGLLWADNRRQKKMSSYEAGRQLGYALAPLILLAGAVYVGRRMGKKRQPPKFVAWPVGLMAVLLLVAFVGLQMKKKALEPPASEMPG